ncbi:acid phosphatase/vanadium-dependent haloperoxidase protein-related protein [Tanacetum coccineum]
MGKIVSGDSVDPNVDTFNLEFGNGMFNGAELKKIMANENLAEMALTDPKSVKRILASRQSTAHSKERKMCYITELEIKVQTLQNYRPNLVELAPWEEKSIVSSSPPLTYKEHRWDLEQLIGSGGMPPSHSATVTALAVAVGLHDGLGGFTFAVALILACIGMYDVTGVRLHAGRQAEVLNQIVFELPAQHSLAESRPLRELLGLFMFSKNDAFGGLL